MLYGYDYTERDEQQREMIDLEIIGSVVRNELTSQWELHVSHASAHIVIRNEFWVLCIEDEAAFEWTPTEKVS